MRTVTITEAKNRLSALLDRVRAGDSILILDRGRPVARLEPAVGAEGEEAGGRLARLERQGLVHRGSGRPVLAILNEPPASAGNGASALEALLEERRAGR